MADPCRQNSRGMARFGLPGRTGPRSIGRRGRTLPKAEPVAGYPQRWASDFFVDVWPEEVAPPRLWYSPLTLAPNDGGEWCSMHIKSVVIDRRVWFVTSANFTERAQERNFELGVCLEDAALAERVVQHFDRGVCEGVFVALLA